MGFPFNRRGSGQKYGNRKCKADGYTFDSEVERARYFCLRQMEAAGEIRDLEVKPRFELVVNGVRISRPFRPDFRFVFVDSGLSRTEDVKGYMEPGDQATKIFNMKCRLVKALYGIEIQVVQTEQTIRRQEARKIRKRNQAHMRRLAQQGRKTG